MTTTLRNIHIALAATAFALAAFFAPQASAQLGDIPALIRTTIPTGDPDGGRISYSIALGEGRELRITVDAGRLVVTISGAIKDQFKIFRMDEGEFVPLECSAGFLGALVGNISCRDVEPGTRLVFARKDLVDQLIPEAAAGEEELFEEEEEFAADEAVFDEGEFVAEEEEEPSLFDRALDFFGFGEEEEPEEFVDEFDFGVESEDEFAFEGEDEEEPSWFDNALDFLGFGGEEEEVVEEGVGEELADFEEGEPSFAEAPADEEGVEEFGETGFVEGGLGEEDELFGVAGGFDEITTSEDELVFGEAEEAEEFAEEGELFGEDGEEFVEGEEEERLLPRVRRKIREAVDVVQYKVADFIAKLYVKPLPLTPEAAEEEDLLLFDEGAAGDVFIDEGAEFLEEPTESDSAPAATVNQAFQRFINDLR